MKDIVVLYHGNCLDGFGGAYSAWKKFGERATYIPCFHGNPPPDVADKEVYIVDFNFPMDEMLALEKSAKRLVALDHHMGARESTEAVAEHIFDNDRSGSGIAWSYFHPEIPLPRLLSYIQDNDLWRHALAHSSEVAAYMSTVEFEFESFDTLIQEAEIDEGFQKIITTGAAYAEYFAYVCAHIAKTAQLVQFDEFTILAANAPRLFRSELGHALAGKHGPFSIVWYVNEGAWHYSLRGDGTIDCSEIAKRYGGNGHHNAASIRRPLSEPFLFNILQNESIGD